MDCGLGVGFIAHIGWRGICRTFGVGCLWHGIGVGILMWIGWLIGSDRDVRGVGWQHGIGALGWDWAVHLVDGILFVELWRWPSFGLVSPHLSMLDWCWYLGVGTISQCYNS